MRLVQTPVFYTYMNDIAVVLWFVF